MLSVGLAFSWFALQARFASHNVTLCLRTGVDSEMEGIDSPSNTDVLLKLEYSTPVGLM